MGQAREVMDAMFTAMLRDVDALVACYASDAVAETPDAGRIEGRDAILEHLLAFVDAFSDITFEAVESLEVGDTAIDEGYVTGRHTGALRTPDGSIAPTGKTLKLRECDLITVRDGVAVSHRFYYDQLEFLRQLGLLDQQEPAEAPPVQRVDPTQAKAPQHS